MLYEFKVLADSPQECSDTLMILARQLADNPALMLGNVVSIARYPNPYPINGGMPQTPEAFAAASRASFTQGAKEPPKAPRKAAAKPTATVVDGPDGEPAAVTEESPFGNAPPVPEPSPTLTPDQMRERSIALLQQAFGFSTGPALVRALQTKMKVKKFNEVADDKCPELLQEAEKILRQLKPAAAE